MIAFDSNVLIYIVEKNPDYFDKARRLLLDMEKIGGICSTIVITECLNGTIRKAAQLAPLTSPSVIVLPVSSQVAELAGTLRIDYGFKIPDSIHIATAIIHRANVFITNDQQLLKKEIPGIKLRGL